MITVAGNSNMTYGIKKIRTTRLYRLSQLLSPMDKYVQSITNISSTNFEFEIGPHSEREVFVSLWNRSTRKQK